MGESKLYYCHYCKEVVEVYDRDLDYRRILGALVPIWTCPNCGCHNEHEACEEQEHDI